MGGRGARLVCLLSPDVASRGPPRGQQSNEGLLWLPTAAGTSVSVCRLPAKSVPVLPRPQSQAQPAEHGGGLAALPTPARALRDGGSVRCGSAGALNAGGNEFLAITEPGSEQARRVGRALVISFAKLWLQMS